jgi:hypothetical protein
VHGRPRARAAVAMVTTRHREASRHDTRSGGVPPAPYLRPRTKSVKKSMPPAARDNPTSPPGTGEGSRSRRAPDERTEPLRVGGRRAPTYKPPRLPAARLLNACLVAARIRCVPHLTCPVRSCRRRRGHRGRERARPRHDTRRAGLLAEDPSRHRGLRTMLAWPLQLVSISA